MPVVWVASGQGYNGRVGRSKSKRQAISDAFPHLDTSGIGHTDSVTKANTKAGREGWTFPHPPAGTLVPGLHEQQVGLTIVLESELAAAELATIGVECGSWQEFARDGERVGGGPKLHRALVPLVQRQWGQIGNGKRGRFNNLKDKRAAKKDDNTLAIERGRELLSRAPAFVFEHVFDELPPMDGVTDAQLRNYNEGLTLALGTVEPPSGFRGTSRADVGKMLEFVVLALLIRKAYMAKLKAVVCIRPHADPTAAWDVYLAKDIYENQMEACLCVLGDSRTLALEVVGRSKWRGTKEFNTQIKCTFTR